MTDHELIMCIVNTGFSEIVMDAAKEKGARGGTVIHARGTANKEAEAFFNITVQPDKEIVMILVPADIRDDVLHAVYQAAGLKTAGQGISFAMPVSHVVGLKTASPAEQTEQGENEQDKPQDPETAEAPEQPNADAQAEEQE
ncbi:MAG: P-II family nitrogen regulator [Clostridiales bacterium]|nr:P-II family nitrogen regulator [Clostridiales bacterium]